MKLKNGEEAKPGDVIRWTCWDNDDLTMWQMTGLYRGNSVIYLGGGIDFGMAIGTVLTEKEVISESEDNDSGLTGIEKVGTAAYLARHISNFGSESC